jgi:hypothetical protein
LLARPAVAEQQQYQTGKIVKVERQQSSGSNTSSMDVPVKAETASYRISILLDGKTYVCLYRTDSERDLSWTEGKEVQARVKGKVMYAKTAGGKQVKGTIVSSSAAPTP